MRNLVAKRIGILRKERMLQQKELSKILRIDPASLSRYEKGIVIPPLDVMVKLCDFFGVSIDWMVGNMDMGQTDYSLAERINTMSKRIRDDEIRDEFYKYLLKQADFTADAFVSLERYLKEK